VTLTSTLNAERVVYPQDIVIFICTTRGSPILEWFSEQYIGTGRDRLQILSESDRNTSTITPDAVATRINATTNDGIIVIVSELRIKASMLYPNATVSCSNGSPKKVNIMFQTIGEFCLLLLYVIENTRLVSTVKLNMFCACRES
jgi:hypothetical protein